MILKAFTYIVFKLKLKMEEVEIFHICTNDSWKDQKDAREYRHESLEIESFIHCSKKDQIKGVLERYFEGVNDLIILTIDSNKVNSGIKYEKALNGEYFPHIFGPINKDAILSINKIK